MKTPKEKAEELVDSFEDDLMDCRTYFLEAAKKRCALITVDELIKYCYKDDIYFWKEVKQEIELL
jgi:hypothetical protein